MLLLIIIIVCFLLPLGTLSLLIRRITAFRKVPGVRRLLGGEHRSLRELFDPLTYTEEGQRLLPYLFIAWIGYLILLFVGAWLLSRILFP